MTGADQGSAWSASIKYIKNTTKLVRRVMVIVSGRD